MLRMFGGMIIGSMMTMVLLGGGSAAEQVLTNAKTMMEQQYLHPTLFGNGMFLLSLGLTLALWATWRTQQTCQTARIIKKIRRYCL